MRKIKKKIKVKFADIPGEKFFKNLLKKDYTLVESEDPDYLFFTLKPSIEQKGNLRNTASGIPFLRKYASDIYQLMCRLPLFDRIFYKLFYDELKMPILRTKAKRIFYTAENCRPDMKNCEGAFTFDYDEDLKNTKHVRIPYYKIEGAGKDLIKKNIKPQEIKKDKTKFCAFIYSKNVPFRNKFFKELSKYKKVDAPGDSMRNMPPFGKQRTAKTRFIPNPTRGDWQNEKLEFLYPYKFTVAFENSSHPGYSTEKIYHPMLVNSIPIYWGNRKVNRDFNTRSFINYYDFEEEVKRKIPKLLLKIPGVNKIIQRFVIEQRTLKKMVKRIIEIDQNDGLYFQYLKEAWYPKNKLTPYVDDEIIREKIKKIIN